MDIRAVSAAQNYNAARPATQADPTEALAAATNDFAQTLQQGEATAMQALAGDADPHSLVQALTQAELAVETVVTVRNKVVEAYQEILRMPV
ncbi:MAG: flagellar hook-basal body complex protein FliE [Pseudooceanicola sp.]|nr:flagellar hook-basal body complex protein FliE [Pseudooceanicola sp.]